MALDSKSDRTALPPTAENALGLAAAINQAGQAVVITDQRGTILYVNAAFTEMTGYSVQDAIGATPRLWKSNQQDPAYYRQLWKTITAGRNWHGELINRRKDGSLYTGGDDHRPGSRLRRARSSAMWLSNRM